MSKTQTKAELRQELERLKPFSRSNRQTELLDAVIEYGSIRAAARALNMTHAPIARAIKRVRHNAARQGWSPEHDMTKVVPDTHYVKGTSTLYGEDGKPKLQWVKSNAKADDLARDLSDFADSLGEQVAGMFKPIKRDSSTPSMDDLLTTYVLADIHLGMLAWSRETREDYDVVIASDAMKTGADLLMQKTPPSRMATIANVGDFFHFDNDDKKTRSGNILDTDGRWSKVVDLGVECLLHFIRRALEKHELVHVINSIGNHDGQSALMLPFILKPYFQNEPRVTIEDAPRDHHYQRFGCNLLGFHHGHKTPAGRLPMAMVTDCLLNSEIDTEGVDNLHWLTGHIHHETREYDGCLVESFRALCAKDAYHAGGGYRAGREMQAVIYHSNYGEVGRERVSYKMIQAFSKIAKESKTA